ncbi:MAG: hypothetical protein EZS28_036986 [Streblomastix strix]|uniref:Uncharacterized protein n=1 Tax=Streblomastix strix TaxID=222440 RepID=A0A5J4UA66_9EUKA|nr:MAG: hypothetical protein EZS28_036986 [Streblomastix strix]
MEQQQFVLSNKVTNIRDPLYILLHASNLRNIRDALVELETLTNQSEHWCLRVASSGAVFILLKLIVSSSVDNDLHKRLIRYTLCILEHMEKFKESSEIIWTTHERKKRVINESNNEIEKEKEYNKQKGIKSLSQQQSAERAVELEKEGKRYVRVNVMDKTIQFICQSGIDISGDEIQAEEYIKQKDGYIIEETDDEEEGYTFCSVILDLATRSGNDESVMRLILVVLLRLVEGNLERSETLKNHNAASFALGTMSSLSQKVASGQNIDKRQLSLSQNLGIIPQKGPISQSSSNSRVQTPQAVSSLENLFRRFSVMFELYR